jgi:cytochrome b561
MISMLKNTPKSFGIITKAFHWVMAAIMLPQIVVGYVMSGLGEGDPLKGVLIYYHKSMGILLLCLVIARIIWRLTEKNPALPKDMPKWQAVAAEWNLTFLYIMMGLMPLSGLLMSLLGGYPVKFFHYFTLSPLTEKSLTGYIFFKTHVIGGYIISASIILHVMAAFYHHLIRKDNVLKRMIVKVD